MPGLHFPYMHSLLEAAFFIYFVIFAIWWAFAYPARSRAFLEQWAKDNGYEILQSDSRLLCCGPFRNASRAQAVYYVRVRDAQGKERSGWVLLGDWFLGVFAENDEVKVQWEDQAESALSK